MAALSDGTPQGTISAGSVSTPPVGWNPLTGNENTAKIPGTLPGQAVINNPLAPPEPTRTENPTVLGSPNIDEKNAANVQNISNQQPKGQQLAPNGFVMNADGSFAHAPNGSVASRDENGNIVWKVGSMTYGIEPLGATTQITPDDAKLSANGMWYDSKGNSYTNPPGSVTSKVSDDPITQGIYDQLTSLKSRMDAVGAAAIESIKQQYEALIAEQRQINKGANAGVYTLLTRGGGLQTESSEGIVQTQVSYGLKQIADLTAKENAAVIQAQQAMQENDYKILDKQLAIANDARKERQSAIDKVQENLQKEKDRLATQNNAIDNDIREAIMSAQKGGATTEQIASMKTALANHDYAGALAAGGDTFQDPTSTAGQYAAYVKRAKAKGLTPMLPGDFLAKQKSNEAYANAYATATGKAAGEAAAGINTSSGPDNGGTLVPGATGITGATGLSIDAFNYLTVGTSALTRMSEGARAKVKKEVNEYLNRKGVDYATFQSQYKALGNTVQANLTRNNQAGVAEAEIDATLANLQTAADDSSFKNMRWYNIAKLFAGQEFNDKNVSKYAFHLNQLREEFAMYNAALAGQIDSNGNIKEITDADRKVAENIIKDGFAKGSIQGFQDALTASREKMKTVLQSSIDAQNKKVWDLFGVGDQYKSQAPTITDSEARDKVNSYVATNPDKADKVANLYSIPGVTDQDILEYLNLIPKQ